MFKKGDKVIVISDFAPYFYIDDVGEVISINGNLLRVDFNRQNNLTVYRHGIWAGSATHFDLK